MDTLEAIHEELLTIAVDGEVADPDGLLRALDALAEAATGVEVVGEVERETTLGGSVEASRAAGLALSPRRSASLSAASRQSVTAHNRVRRTGVERHRVLFGPPHPRVAGRRRARFATIPDRVGHTVHLEGSDSSEFTTRPGRHRPVVR